jgi:hypothetical protein
MPVERDAVLHLGAAGGVEAALLRDLLGAAHDAYSGYIAFDRIVSDIEQTYGDPPFWRRRLERDLPVGLGPVFWYPQGWDRPGLADPFVFANERLLVFRVELRSPGFLEFLGALNPLEVIRKGLNDRHRRRQDRQYREREEARQLGLENDLREIDVIARRLEVARGHGVPEEALAPLLQQLIERPMNQLGALQDGGVIDATSVEIRELPSGESSEGRQD